MPQRRRVATVFVTVAAVVAAGWLAVVLVTSPRPAPQAPPAQPTTTAPSPTTPPPTPAAPAASPFTGLERPLGPVLAVKVDNVRAARPQLGLSAADLVYVEPVEGGLSRLVAVFCGRLPDAVGPVRSARDTDLELLHQFGAPALAYSGAAPEVLARLGAGPLVSVSPVQAPQAYFREPSRRPPHNSYARPAELLAAAPGAAAATDIGFRFGDPPVQGNPSGHEVAGYPAAHYTFDWSADQGRWLVGLDGSPLLAAEGGQLGAPTVVLQSVVVRPSGIADVLGNPSPYAETVGAGGAVVLRDGASFAATWSRPALDTGTTFTTPDGQPLPFARGPVWIVLVPAAG